MKPFIFCFALAGLLTGAVSAQTTVQWSDSTVIASTPLAITAPRVFGMTGGDLLVTWGTSGNPAQIWCSRMENGVFGTPVGVVQEPAEPSLFGFGGYDVAIHDSTVYVVFEQLQSGIFLTVSHNGGKSFETPVEVQGGVQGGYVTLASVVVDGTGNPVVSYILDKNGAIYQVRRSADGGQSFGSPVTANAPAPGGAVCECCTSDLLASGDSVWIVFRNNNQNLRDIWVSRSIDLAASFSTATDVDQTDWVLNSCPISGPRMARSGDSLLLAWMSKAGSNGRIYLSTLHARTMQAGQQIGMPYTPGPLNAQTFADVTANGDTVGLVHVEKSRELLFYHSVNGTQGLTDNGKRFAVAGHALTYPSILYHQGAFHLLYVDLTADKILYRKGLVQQSSAVGEPRREDVSIYPNPVTDGWLYLSTTTSEYGNINLTDISGRVVLRTGFSGFDTPVDLSGLQPGLYFLRLESEKGNVELFAGKIVVK